MRTAWGLAVVAAAVLLCASHALGHSSVIVDGRFEHPVAVGYDDVEGAEGFLLYCPCVGRFGGQVDMLLGALALAKSANRTLVIPPFILLVESSTTPRFASFDQVFEMAPILAYHRVVTLESFMESHGSAWHPRPGYCFRSPAALNDPAPQCNHKVGNPFALFWDHFGVSFTSSHYISTDLAVRDQILKSDLTHDVQEMTSDAKLKWDATLPASRHPYVTLNSGPVAPVDRANRALQAHLEWHPVLREMAEKFIDRSLRRPYVGVHLRNNPAWVSVCRGADARTSPFLASPQCLPDGAAITGAMCLPTFPHILERVRQAVRRSGARSVFIATDDRALAVVFEKQLSLPVVVSTDEAADLAHLGPAQPAFPTRQFLDLQVLTEADIFVGNCLSTHSAFVKRARKDRPTMFFGLND